MNDVEWQYREAIAGWSGRRRVERSCELFREVREMLARKVLAEEPGLTPHAVRRRVAAQMYRTDRETMRLLALLDS